MKRCKLCNEMYPSDTLDMFGVCPECDLEVDPFSDIEEDLLIDPDFDDMWKDY